jgi:hypothetical protein
MEKLHQLKLGLNSVLGLPWQTLFLSTLRKSIDAEGRISTRHYLKHTEEEQMQLLPHVNDKKNLMVQT